MMISRGMKLWKNNDVVFLLNLGLKGGRSSRKGEPWVKFAFLPCGKRKKCSLTLSISVLQLEAKKFE